MSKNILKDRTNLVLIFILAIITSFFAGAFTSGAYRYDLDDIPKTIVTGDNDLLEIHITKPKIGFTDHIELHLESSHNDIKDNLTFAKWKVLGTEFREIGEKIKIEGANWKNKEVVILVELDLGYKKIYSLETINTHRVIYDFPEKGPIMAV